MFTFALGTAVGDLYSEQLGVGYLKTGLIVLVILACVFVAWKRKLNEILAFWIAYILTRPLGASLGDYLSQTKQNGGLAFGATLTSVIFLSAIVVIIVYLALAKNDFITKGESDSAKVSSGTIKRVWTQTVSAVVLFLAVGIGGYIWCNQNLVPDVASSQTTLSGQLNDFITIENEILANIDGNNLSAAKSKANDLEHDWDQAEPKLRKIDRKTWTRIDGTIDDVLAAVRTKSPNVDKCDKVLGDSLDALSASNQS
ncbi:COG4705 family protein [Paenibacillus rhizovicinus]|uniref:hypothetical protein n=1 Tax=Paenibacillus rhizovicinus TaxID=2704463 RepID=UPI001CDC0239|nr:hypothetical protein [Paenibacillus rhizovicinus]